MYKKNKKDNKIKYIKLTLGIIIGIFISITTVYGVTIIGNGSDLTYDSSKVWLTSSTAQDALDELYNKGVRCPDGYICEKKKNSLSVGDYVSMTPTKSSYITDTSKTGYTSTQTINPQELNLWRVISINADGTVDMISEYVSSTQVYFSGITGYKNFVGYLNVLASQYENSTYTKGSRAFGYNGQTEYITSTTIDVSDSNTYLSPWDCGTGKSCNPTESDGGGDRLYIKDYNLVKNNLKSMISNNLLDVVSSYWIASRYFYYSSYEDFSFIGNFVMNTGELCDDTDAYYTSPYQLLGSGEHVEEIGEVANSIRPIVVLKAGLKYSGAGTIDHPMQISVS